MTDYPTAFPAIAISPAQHPWVPEGIEELHRLDTVFELTRGSEELNSQRFSWTIFDATGVQWTIAESPKAGPKRGLLTAEFQFALRFERVGKARLADLKARIVAAVRGTPELFLDDEVLAGEANAPIEDSAVLLDAVCSRIERARSFKGAYEGVWADQLDLNVVKPRPESEVAENAERRRRDLVFLIRLLWWGAVAFAVFALGIRLLPPPYDDLFVGAWGVAIAYFAFREKLRSWWTRFRRAPGA